MRRPEPGHLRLGALQRWFQGRIVAPHDRAALAAGGGRRPSDVVLPSQTLTSKERIEIYSRAYFARLHDCLVEDFRAIHQILGEERFRRLARAYLARFPSRHYSLNFLGRALPRFLEKYARVPRRRLLLDLARLELAMAEVFDAEERPALTAREFGSLPADLWASARLRPIPAFRVLAFDHPADAIVTAVRQEKPLPRLTRRRTFTAVFRKQYVVWRMDLDETEFTLLDALASGRTVGQAVRAASRAFPGNAAELERRMSAWFRRWASEGLFGRIEARGISIEPGSRVRRVSRRSLEITDERRSHELGNRAF